MKLKSFALIAMLLLTGLVAACSKSSPPSPNTEPAPANQPEAAPKGSAVPAASHEPHTVASKDEIPTAVKAAFPNAQITMLHKDLTSAQITAIEQGSGAKLHDTDFHTYVAYGTEGGKRTQIGAATVVDIDAAGQPLQVMVVYSNAIIIKQVTPLKGTGDIASATFLNQFVGKDHDQPFHIGKDISYTGKNRDAAEAVAHALKRDILAMQTLYGKTHSH